MIRAGCILIALAAAAQAPSSPVIRGRDVTFVAVGDAADPPRIVGDFKGWEAAR